MFFKENIYSQLLFDRPITITNETTTSNNGTQNQCDTFTDEKGFIHVECSGEVINGNYTYFFWKENITGNDDQYSYFTENKYSITNNDYEEWSEYEE